MKTFFVYVSEPRKRSVSVTKCIVVAENRDTALELVKAYYPANTVGWAKNAEFLIGFELPPNTVKMVG